MDVETAYDQVANITIISEDANEGIGNKRPDEYLRNIDDEEILRSHFIPSDRELWKPENYYNFLQERKKYILRELKNRIFD